MRVMTAQPTLHTSVDECNVCVMLMRVTTAQPKTNITHISEKQAFMFENIKSFFIHINAFIRKTINKAMTRPNQAHMYSDQGHSSVFIN